MKIMIIALLIAVGLNLYMFGQITTIDKRFDALKQCKGQYNALVGTLDSTLIMEAKMNYSKGHQ